MLSSSGLRGVAAQPDEYRRFTPMSLEQHPV
jgi:hypothetical protein